MKMVNQYEKDRCDLEEKKRKRPSIYTIESENENCNKLIWNLFPSSLPPSSRIQMIKNAPRARRRCRTREICYCRQFFINSRFIDSRPKIMKSLCFKTLCQALHREVLCSQLIDLDRACNKQSFEIKFDRRIWWLLSKKSWLIFGNFFFGTPNM